MDEHILGFLTDLMTKSIRNVAYLAFYIFSLNNLAVF